MPAAGDSAQLLTEIAELERKLSELRRKTEGLIEREPLPEGDVALLVCRVGSDPVAFLQEAVDEVVMMAKLSSLPGSVPWVLGLLDYRGVPVPVIDVWARLHGAPRKPLLSDLIVIVQVDGRSIGLLVQEIFDVCRAPSAAIERPSSQLVQAPYLLGVLRYGEKAAVLSARLLVESSGLVEEEAA